jgi:hypothetical protein
MDPEKRAQERQNDQNAEKNQTRHGRLVAQEAAARIIPQRAALHRRAWSMALFSAGVEIRDISRTSLSD